ILGGALIGTVSQFTYLILVGGINTVSMMLSLVTLYTIDKARNGSIIVVQELLKQIDLNMLILFLGVALITGGVGVFLTLKIAKLFSKFIVKVNYSALCLSVILFIAVLVYFFTGWLGLLILAISTAVGIIPGPLQIGRNHAMGCLLLPVILYFIL
ncbi:tripartite tricarboxylate transporter permease, partial [Nanoarchaeota archaeon]